MGPLNMQSPNPKDTANTAGDVDLLSKLHSVAPHLPDALSEHNLQPLTVADQRYLKDKQKT